MLNGPLVWMAAIGAALYVVIVAAYRWLRAQAVRNAGRLLLRVHPARSRRGTMFESLLSVALVLFAAFSFLAENFNTGIMLSLVVLVRFTARYIFTMNLEFREQGILLGAALYPWDGIKAWKCDDKNQLLLQINRIGYVPFHAKAEQRDALIDLLEQRLPQAHAALTH